VGIRLDKFFHAHIHTKSWKAPIILVGHAITWMGLIWLYCKNKLRDVESDSKEKARWSVLRKNGNGFLITSFNGI